MRHVLPIEIPKAEIEAFCRRFGVEEFSLFGSVLRDDFGPDSDVDVMLKFLPEHGFTFENTPDIQDELERIFNRPVDVIEKDRVRNPIRWKSIQNSYQVVYAAWQVGFVPGRRSAAGYVDGGDGGSVVC